MWRETLTACANGSHVRCTVDGAVDSMCAECGQVGFPSTGISWHPCRFALARGRGFETLGPGKRKRGGAETASILPRRVRSWDTGPLAGAGAERRPAREGRDGGALPERSREGRCKPGGTRQLHSLRGRYGRPSGGGRARAEGRRRRIRAPGGDRTDGRSCEGPARGRQVRRRQRGGPRGPGTRGRRIGCEERDRQGRASAAVPRLAQGSGQVRQSSVRARVGRLGYRVSEGRAWPPGPPSVERGRIGRTRARTNVRSRSTGGMPGFRLP